MRSLTEFAKHELDLLVGDEKDEMQELMNKQVLEIVETFSSHGHSGLSAQYAINLISRLLRYKPITPLTGEDNEWNLVSEHESGENSLYQNRRCPQVFKEVLVDGTAKAYDQNAFVFSDDGGQSWFTNRNSMQEIQFPYTVPTNPQYIILEAQQEGE